MSAVNFQQPEVKAPTACAKYYYAQCGHVIDGRWGHNGGSPFERSMLELGAIYLTHEACTQRIAYDAQEMARLVIPAWFRALGSDVEVNVSMPWTDAPDWQPASKDKDWSKENPSRFRAKPKAAPDVVVNVNGVEYRWPATAKQGDPIGDRFTAQINCVEYSPASYRCGNRVHKWRGGAEIQNAMLLAALGGGV